MFVCLFVVILVHSFIMYILYSVFLSVQLNSFKKC